MLETCEQSDRTSDLLDEVVFVLYASLWLRPSSHPNRCSSLHNLANALMTRFEQMNPTHLNIAHPVRPRPDNLFQWVLEKLWFDVVHPVIKALRLQVRSNITLPQNFFLLISLNSRSRTPLHVSASDGVLQVHLPSSQFMRLVRTAPPLKLLDFIVHSNVGLLLGDGNLKVSKIMQLSMRL